MIEYDNYLFQRFYADSWKPYRKYIFRVKSMKDIEYCKRNNLAIIAYNEARVRVSIMPYYTAETTLMIQRLGLPSYPTCMSEIFMKDDSFYVYAREENDVGLVDTEELSELYAFDLFFFHRKYNEYTRKMHVRRKRNSLSIFVNKYSSACVTGTIVNVREKTIVNRNDRILTLVYYRFYFNHIYNFKCNLIRKEDRIWFKENRSNPFLNQSRFNEFALNKVLSVMGFRMSNLRSLFDGEDYYIWKIYVFPMMFEGYLFEEPSTEDVLLNVLIANRRNNNVSWDDIKTEFIRGSILRKLDLTKMKVL